MTLSILVWLCISIGIGLLILYFMVQRQEDLKTIRNLQILLISQSKNLEKSIGLWDEASKLIERQRKTIEDLMNKK